MSEDRLPTKEDALHFLDSFAQQLRDFAFLTVTYVSRITSSDGLTSIEVQAKGPGIGDEPPPVVWLVEDHTDASPPLGAFASQDAAIEWLKARFPDPYRVTWRGPEDGDEDDSVYLWADFEAVLGYSTKHMERYRIWSVPVEGIEE